MYQFISPTLETELLSHIVHNQSFLEKCIECLPVDRLGSKVLKSIYFEIWDYYALWGKVPDKNSIEQKFRDSSSEEDFNNIKEFTKKIWDVKYLSIPDAVLKDALAKYKARKLAIAVQKIGNLLKEGRTNECDALLANYTEITSGVNNEGNFKETEIGESLNSVLTELRNERDNPKQFRGIPTKFIGIDAIIKGVLPGELALIVGKTGTYKSTFLTNISVNAFLSGKVVVMFVIESSPKQYLLNIYSYISGINSEKLHETNFTDEEFNEIEKKVNKYAKKCGGKLIFIDAPQGLNTRTLQSQIRKLKKKYKKLDMIVVDYMGIMENTDSKISFYDWKNLATISKDIKAIARAEDLPVWSAVQEISKKSIGKEENVDDSTDDIAFARAITHNVDICIKVRQDSQQRLMNSACLNFLKIRRAGKPESPIIIETKLSCHRLDNVSTMKVLNSVLLD